MTIGARGQWNDRARAFSRWLLLKDRSAPADATIPVRDRFRSEERLRVIRERLRPDAANPPRVWIRRTWPGLAALAFAIGGVAALDTWLLTCGFSGCPTAAEIRAYRPSEGGRILDHQGDVLGRMTP